VVAGDECDVGCELDERVDPALITRRGPGDIDLDLSEGVNHELAASDDSWISPETGNVLSSTHPAEGFDDVDGERGNKERIFPPSRTEIRRRWMRECGPIAPSGAGRGGFQTPIPRVSSRKDLAHQRPGRIINSFADECDGELTGVVCGDSPRLDGETEKIV
jgi:hypothetical protein